MIKKKVPTNKTTTLAVWLELVKEECARVNISFTAANALQHKHAWEFGNTPSSWVDTIRRRLEHRAFKSQIYDDKNLFKDYFR